MAVKMKRTWGGKRRGAGRPISNQPRCPCAVMTLRRAKARGKSLDHDPSCPFSK